MWEQVGILVLIGLISLIDWAMRKSRERRASRKLRRAEVQPPNPYVAQEAREEPAPRQDEELRRFMEALGLPPTALGPQELPPPIHRPQVTEYQEPPAPPVIVSPPPQPIPRVETRQHVIARAARPTAEQRSLAARLSAVESLEPPDSRPAVSGPLRESLRTREALRRAVLAREILGPPMALRDSEMGGDYKA